MLLTQEHTFWYCQLRPDYAFRKEIEMSLYMEPGLILNLPLYRVDGAGFCSSDAYGHKCVAMGGHCVAGGRLFDGVDDIICVPDCPQFDFGTDRDCTIMIWFRQSDCQRDAYIAAKRDTDIGQRRILIFISSMTGKLGISIKDGVNSMPLLQSRENIKNDHRWHCVVFSCDRDHIRGAQLDLDGVLQGIADPTNVGDISTPGRDLVIGATYSQGWFRDCIGEVMVWNRALTLPERQRLFLSNRESHNV